MLVADAQDPLLGHTLGHFSIAAELGRGGIGIVYRAKDLVLDRDVALKILRPERARDRSERQRFLREARTAASIVHPSLATVYEAGAVGATAYVAMELLAGPDVRRLLEGRGALPLREALEIARDVGSALACVHAAGLVHRDVKPSNVLLDAGGRAKLVDFGLARRADEVGLTAEGAIAGTPGYMSPEQARGLPLDSRSDLYALGVLVRELLCGSRDRDLPSVPAELAAILHACVETDPARRPSAARACEVFQALAGTPGAPAAAPRPLSRSIVGRDRELAAVADALERGARLVTITGPGGIGKTRIARELVRRRRAQMGASADRVQLVDLAAARSIGDLVHAVAAAIGVSGGGSSTERAIDEIGAALADRGHDLVVLDDFEQLAAEGGRVLSRWIDRAPGTAFVVTSRVVLRTEEEEPIEIGALPLDDASELFRQRARRVRTDLRIDDGDLRALVDALDRSPLAIELAAARMSVMTPRALLERLPERLSFLGGAHPGAKTLEDVVRWSWDLLSPPARSALAQLSVFPGSFDLEAAEAVVVLEGSSVVDAIQTLRDGSMLRATDTDGTLSFATYATVRAFAEVRLSQSSEEAAGVARRHSKLCGARGRSWLARNRERPCGLPELGVDRDSVARAARRALESGDDDALEDALPAITALALATAGETLDPDLGEILEALLVRAREKSLPAEPRAAGMLALGRLRYEQDLSRALACFDEVIALSSDPAHVLEARAHRAQVVVQLGRTAEADVESAGAVAAARAAGLERELAIALTVRAAVSIATSDAKEGEACAREAYAIASRRGDARSMAWIAYRLGMAIGNGARYDEALAVLEDALRLVERAGQERLRPRIVNHVGALLLEKGDVAEARARFASAVDLASRASQPVIAALALGNLGVVEHGRDQLERAVELFEMAIERCETANESYVRALWLGWLGASQAGLDRIDRAEAALARGREIAERHQYTVCATVVAIGEAHVALARARRDPTVRDAELRAAREILGRTATASSDSIRIASRALARALERA